MLKTCLTEHVGPRSLSQLALVIQRLTSQAGGSLQPPDQGKDALRKTRNHYI